MAEAKAYRIDRVICSPALRAKQTCQFFTKKLDILQNNVVWENGLYDASLNELIHLINQYNKGIHTLLIIGHNPGLGQLFSYLSKDPPPVNSTGKLLTIAAIAVLDYGHATITAKSHYARLQYLIRPKEL